jgi:hypothetical protein
LMIVPPALPAAAMLNGLKKSGKEFSMPAA